MAWSAGSPTICGDAALVDHDGDRELLDRVAVAGRRRRLAVDFVVGLLFLLVGLVVRCRPVAAGLRGSLRNVLFDGRRRIRLALL